MATPIFLLEKFHGHRSLVGYSPWGQKELGMTECTRARTHMHTYHQRYLFGQTDQSIIFLSVSIPLPLSSFVVFTEEMQPSINSALCTWQVMTHQLVNTSQWQPTPVLLPVKSMDGGAW